LSGATLTSRGVENMVAYWLGDEGYGPILKNMN
ncbi:MAG: Na(+)-translocating NADH-quinone reductase subunit C, partial [Gammaproteobacteria bacterium]